jgi:6-phosphofructokinase 1
LSIKKIGILTSGGDAPGMNAAVRAVVRTASYYKMKTTGIHYGFQGLLEKDFFDIDNADVRYLIQRGGTMLGTARCKEFQEKAYQEQGVNNLREAGIEGMIVIGGDGSFMGAKALSELNMPTIGIPGTIDNDLPYTDSTIGFQSALSTVVEAISRIRNTADSHRRIMIVEAMGRHSGNIAMYAGIASGSEIIMIPEMPLPITEVADRLKQFHDMGKHSSIIVVAEGAYNDDIPDIGTLKEKLTELTGLEIKSNKLGYMQRGGTPAVEDRLLASRMGYHAVRLLLNGVGNRVVGTVQDEIIDEDIHKALSERRRFDFDLFEMARTLSGTMLPD